MKHKRFCYETIRQYFLNDIITFDKNRFNFSKLRNPLASEKMIRMYIGNSTTLVHIVGDVILFKKDGNMLTINLREFKSYLAGMKCEKYKIWMSENSEAKLV